jgi:hypothetical protein
MLLELFLVWLVGCALLLAFSVVDRNPSYGIIAGVLLILLGLIVFTDNIQVKSGESVAYTSSSQGNLTNTYNPIAFSPPASTQTVVALPLVLSGLGISFAKVVSL